MGNSLLIFLRQCGMLTVWNPRARGDTMLTIAAVDDEPEFLSELTDALHKLTEHMEETRITAFSDSTAFLQANEPFDLIFMDIDMPVINGMEVAALLRERNSNAALIFISSYEHFVFESIRYMPFRFIRKGLYQKELPEAVQSFLKERRNPIRQMQTRFFSLKKTEKCLLLLTLTGMVPMKQNYRNISCSVM